MERLERLGLGLTIQPIYIQLLVYVIAMDVLFSFVNRKFLGSAIPGGIVVLESIYCGMAITIGTTFSVRRSYGLLNKKDIPYSLKYWVEFQKAVIYNLLTDKVEAINSFPGLIKKTLVQRNRTCVYAPVIFILGILTNLIAFFITGQGYWLLLSVIVALVGSACFYDSVCRLRKTKNLADRLIAKH